VNVGVQFFVGSVIFSFFWLLGCALKGINWCEDQGCAELEAFFVVSM
jgi:hypothetical protein